MIKKKQTLPLEDKIVTVLSSRGDNNDDLEVEFDDSFNDNHAKKTIQQFPLTARLAAKEKMLSPMQSVTDLKTNRGNKQGSMVEMQSQRVQLKKVMQKNGENQQNHLR
jgi:hypothetical protein